MYNATIEISKERQTNLMVINLSCKTSGEDSRISKPFSVIFKYWILLSLIPLSLEIRSLNSNLLITVAMVVCLNVVM